MLKRTRWVKAAVWLLIVGILLTLQHCLYPWPKRLPHVRLEPSRPILRDADVTPDNAFFYLRQLADAPKPSDDWTREYYRFWSLGVQGDPYPALEARLLEMAPNLRLCHQAAEAPRCQMVTIESYNERLTHLRPLRDILWNLRVSAECSAARNDWGQARDACCLALRLEDDLTRGSSLIGPEISRRYGVLTFDGLRRLTVEDAPPPEFLHDMILFLDDLDCHTEPLAETLRYEILVTRNRVREVDGCLVTAFCLVSSHHVSRTAVAIDTALTCTVWPLLGSTPRRTAAHLDAIYAHVIDIASDPRPGGRSFAELRSFAGDGFPPSRIFFDDPIGRYWVWGLFPARDNEADYSRAHAAILRGTELVLAVRLYQQTHDGKLPARLEDLVPGCIAALPADPFSTEGQSFLYHTNAPGEWVLYSRGPNLRDDGAAWNYLDLDVRYQHRHRVDIVFSSSEFVQRRDDWRREHPDESVER